MTATTSTATAASAAPVHHRGRRLVAAVMMVATLMDMIDVTIVNVALPTIRRDLGASGTQLEWVISAYMLAFAATLIIAGSFGDVFGRKRVFLIGIACFGAASLGAGLAQSPNELIVARVIQGAAAAAMLPQVLATFREIFSGKERGQVFGVYGAVLGFASAIGLLLGGVLTDANLFGWSWRSVFFVNLPVAVFSFVATLRLVPETRNQSAARPNFAGAVLLAGALVAIVYPLLEGRQLGWPVWGWLLLAAGVVTLGALGVAEERRRQPRTSPLLRARLFRTPAFSAGLTVQLFFSAGLQGFFVVLALWMQAGQHYSPLRSGVTLLAFSLGSFVGAPLAIPMAQKHGRGVVASGGLLLAAGAVAIDLGARSVGTSISPWPLVPGLVVAGFGLALLVIPLVNVVLAAVPAQAAGGASGLFSTAQQLGGALGVAAVGTVFFSRLDSGTFTDAFTTSVPYVAGAFLIAGALSLVLPRRAVDEEFLYEAAA